MLRDSLLDALHAKKLSRELILIVYRSLSVPSVHWEDMSIYFAFGLPQTKKGRDSIFVVVDRFFKKMIFIPCYKSDDPIHVAYLFFCEIVRLCGVSTTIISYHGFVVLIFLATFGDVYWLRCTWCYMSCTH